MSTSNVIGLWALMPFRTGNQTFPSRAIKPNHEEFEIVLSGKAVLDTPNGLITVTAGDAVWLQAGEQTIHSDAEGTPYECLVLSFLVNEQSTEPRSPVYRWVGPIGPQQFADDALFCLRRCEYDSLTFCHYLYSACKLHLLPTSEAQSNKSYILDGILTFLEVNLREELSTETIAENFSMTTNQLSYLFQQEFGLPPYQYLRRLRLHRAEAYLLETDKPIKWITYMCGYRSESGFIRAFVKTHEKSPMEFRHTQNVVQTN